MAIENIFEDEFVNKEEFISKAKANGTWNVSVFLLNISKQIEVFVEFT